jgi:hypothetical protein
MHDAAVEIANSFRPRMGPQLQSGALNWRRERDTRRIVGYFQASGDVMEVGRWCPVHHPKSLLDRPPSESAYW